MQRLVKAWAPTIGVSADEVQLAGGMFAYQFLVVCTFIVGRTVRDTLYLDRVGPEALPIMYVFSAVAVAAAGFCYSRVADQFRRDRSAQATLLSAGVLMAILWASVVFAPQIEAWYPVLYVLVEVVGALSIIQFWTLANDIFTSQQSKRLFGFIGAGGVVANILCGMGVGGLSLIVGPSNLLLVDAALFVGAFTLVSRIGDRAKPMLMDALTRPRGFSPKAVAGGHDAHLRSIGMVVAVTFLVVTLVDFQFKVTAKEVFSDERALASFFGYFYGVGGIAAAGVQLFVTSRVLTRAGIVAGLAILPAAILMGAGAWLLFPGAIVGASLMRAAENVFRYTVYDATVHLLYVPVPGHRRGRAKAFIDGVLKPTSIGVVGVTLFALTQTYGAGIVARSALGADVALILVWLGLIFQVRRAYVRSLAEALETRRLEPDETTDLVDEDAQAVIRQQLQQEDPVKVLHALELVRDLSVDALDDLIRLLEHPDPEVRTRSLQLLEPRRSLESRNAVKACLDAPEASVRAAAIQTLLAIDPERAPVALDALSSPEREVRAAAVIGLARYGDFRGQTQAGQALETMLASSEVADRLAGIRIIRAVQWQDFAKTLQRLLNDSSRRVRRAAIQAAGELESLDLLVPLVYKLSDEDVAASSVGALFKLGAEATPVLIKVLLQPQEDLRIRRRVPRVLAQWGDDRAYQAVLETLRSKDPELRSACARAAARIRERHPHFPLDHHTWTELVEPELTAIGYDRALALLFARNDAELLSSALAERAERRLGRVGDLFILRHPGQGLRAAFNALRSPSPKTRSQALELLENVLDRAYFRMLVSLLDNRTGDGVPEVDSGALTWARILATEPDGWVASVALEWIARNGTAIDQELVLSRFDAVDGMVRETACYAAMILAQRFPPQRTRAEDALTQALSDRSDRVRAASAALLEAPSM
mgnify:CR=1 FL=1